MKVAYLAVREASKKWTMPIQNWKLALRRFSIEFGERVPITFNLMATYTLFKIASLADHPPTVVAGTLSSPASQVGIR